MAFVLAQTSLDGTYLLGLGPEIVDCAVDQDAPSLFPGLNPAALFGEEPLFVGILQRANRDPLLLFYCKRFLLVRVIVSDVVDNKRNHLHKREDKKTKKELP